MDTPERNKIGTTSVSKFEDSPVFNYINSLSPIKPVKSTHITQALNPLSFVALPSVFTSPHVISRKESRFLRRHNKYSDPADPEVPSADGNKNYTSEGGALKVSQLSNNSTGTEENFDSGASMSNLSIYLLNNSPNSIEELQRLNCCTAIPNGDPVNPDVIQVDGLSEFADTSDLILSNGENHRENGSPEPIREEIYDWEGLIGDGADLLIFASPSGSEAIRPIQKPIEPSSEFSPTIMGVQNDSNYKQIKPILYPVNPRGQREAEESSSHSAETRDIDEHRKLDIVTYSNSEKCVTHCTGEKIDNEVAGDCPIYHEPISTMHRGLRRRCLDFEKVGTHKKNSSEGSICSSTMSHGDENLASNNNLHSKSAGSSSIYIFNGIGLHLNVLAASSNGFQDVNHENLSQIRHPSLPSTIAQYPSPRAEEESLLASAVTQKDADPSENTVQMDEDASHGSPYVLAGQDINQNSPKKKRPREYSEESESCKRCNCKKSKCLKLYCECFAAGVYCIEPCSCQECFNKPIHKDTVLATRKQIEARNPLAFAPKVIRNSETVLELGEESTKTPASARHKRGCNCKKSSCLKKYCECYQGGVGCSITCRCEGCKNAFGRKDVLVELESEQKEDETEASFKSVEKKPSPLRSEIQNIEEQNPGLHLLLPSTPLQLCRPVDPLPFSSRPKLCSSFLITGSSTGQKPENLSILGPQVKLDKTMKAVLEDEMPEILRTSPNSKRVSPPKSGLVSLRIPRTGRKLILQSIPSFPSLTQQH